MYRLFVVKLLLAYLLEVVAKLKDETRATNSLNAEMVEEMKTEQNCRSIFLMNSRDAKKMVLKIYFYGI